MQAACHNFLVMEFSWTTISRRKMFRFENQSDALYFHPKDSDDKEDPDKDEEESLIISCSNSSNRSRKRRSSFLSLFAQKKKSNSNPCCLELSDSVMHRLTWTPSFRTCLVVVKTRPAIKSCFPSPLPSRLRIASRSYHSNSWSSTNAFAFLRMHSL